MEVEGGQSHRLALTLKNLVNVEIQGMKVQYPKRLLCLSRTAFVRRF